MTEITRDPEEPGDGFIPLGSSDVSLLDVILPGGSRIDGRSVDALSELLPDDLQHKAAEFAWLAMAESGSRPQRNQHGTADYSTAAWLERSGDRDWYRNWVHTLNPEARRQLTAIAIRD